MHKRYEISANYTVEAAFVVPIILGMIFSMIYMLFVLHDKVILHENIRYNVICIDENDGNYKKTSNEKTSYEKVMDKKASDKKISNDKNLSKNNSKKFLSEKSRIECNKNRVYLFLSRLCVFLSFKRLYHNKLNGWGYIFITAEK